MNKHNRSSATHTLNDNPSAGSTALAARGFRPALEYPAEKMAVAPRGSSRSRTRHLRIDGNDADNDLLPQAKAGDLASFEALVTRNERRIYTVARRITGNEQDAEDVTQQAFISALHHLNTFRQEASFLTWLKRIATHAALKVVRKRKGLPTVSLEVETEPQEGYDTVTHPEYIADWRESPEELVQRNETTQLIGDALNRLDDKHRLVFLLRDVEGFSIKETADVLGLTEANVKVRLLRARLQLREQLTGVFGDPAKRLEPHRHDHE